MPDFWIGGIVAALLILWNLYSLWYEETLDTDE
jgi:hypothetical protein